VVEPADIILHTYLAVSAVWLMRCGCKCTCSCILKSCNNQVLVYVVEVWLIFENNRHQTVRVLMVFVTGAVFMQFVQNFLIA